MKKIVVLNDKWLIIAMLFRVWPKTFGSNRNSNSNKCLNKLPIIVIVILQIKTIEQNIVLSSRNITPKSVAVQLPPNLV